jgi:hypothetical protein
MTVELSISFEAAPYTPAAEVRIQLSSLIVYVWLDMMSKVTEQHHTPSFIQQTFYTLFITHHAHLSYHYRRRSRCHSLCKPYWLAGRPGF